MKSILLIVAAVAALALGGCRLDIDDDDADDTVSRPPGETPALVKNRPEA